MPCLFGIVGGRDGRIVTCCIEAIAFRLNGARAEFHRVIVIRLGTFVIVQPRIRERTIAIGLTVLRVHLNCAITGLDGLRVIAATDLVVSKIVPSDSMRETTATWKGCCTSTA